MRVGRVALLGLILAASSALAVEARSSPDVQDQVSLNKVATVSLQFELTQPVVPAIDIELVTVTSQVAAVVAIEQVTAKRGTMYRTSTLANSDRIHTSNPSARFHDRSTIAHWRDNDLTRTSAAGTG